MTTKADLTAEEWEAVVHGPTTAGLIVITAQRGGTFRETLAMTKAYVEARKEHGLSELLDAILSSRPSLDRTRYRTPEELQEAGLRHLSEAVEVLGRKATREELGDYGSFVVSLAERVAHAHREQGAAVSESEQAAIDQVRAVVQPAGGA